MCTCECDTDTPGAQLPVERVANAAVGAVVSYVSSSLLTWLAVGDLAAAAHVPTEAHRVRMLVDMDGRRTGLRTLGRALVLPRELQVPVADLGMQRQCRLNARWPTQPLRGAGSACCLPPLLLPQATMHCPNSHVDVR